MKDLLNRIESQSKECEEGTIFSWGGDTLSGGAIEHEEKCSKCQGKGYKPLSGSSFSCALVIFDRRNL